MTGVECLYDWSVGGRREADNSDDSVRAERERERERACSEDVRVQWDCSAGTLVITPPGRTGSRSTTITTEAESPLWRRVVPGEGQAGCRLT